MILSYDQMIFNSLKRKDLLGTGTFHPIIYSPISIGPIWFRLIEFMSNFCWSIRDSIIAQSEELEIIRRLE